MSKLYDISCYTDICKSIGKTNVGIINFNYTNNPITCNCTILNPINEPFPDISLPNDPKPTFKPTSKPIVDPKPTIQPTKKPITQPPVNSNSTKRHQFLLLSMSLLTIILTL
jgi:hypothetical protein